MMARGEHSLGADDLPAGDEPAARLAAWIDRLTAAFRAGTLPDWPALEAEDAALAAELRELWPTIAAAEVVARQTAAWRSDEALSDVQPADGLVADSPQPRPAAWPDAPPTAVAPADRLPRAFGEYELIEVLGQGGMGVVYRARQRSLGREVALKMILNGAWATPDQLARFRAEAAAAARIDHPHIVPVYEVGEHAGQPYFTMKYVAGRTLAELLADGPLASRDAARLLAPVCRAIDAAHQRGIVHRDLKPSNILLDAEDVPHVTDFGLARQQDEPGLTLSGAVVGTPTFMSPEQATADRQRLGPASDVYSLGAVLYQMLTGRPPLEAATPAETVMLVLEQDPPPPRVLNPGVDADLELVVLKCLQKPPELRYATAGRLADDLEAWLADEPVSARSGAFTQVLARWLRETHHATVLENWGLLWMWHSLALLTICLLTNLLQWRGAVSRWPYLLLWIAGLGAWAAIFWALRRRTGPVTFVERQIAHVWAASMASIAVLFLVEQALRLPVLALSPVLAISSGMVFLVKAGILSGRFYLQAIVLFATAPVMAWLDRAGLHVSITLFGLVSAACFFVPGLKYYRQQRRSVRIVPADGPAE